MVSQVDKHNAGKLGALQAEQEAAARRMGLDPASISISITAHDSFETPGMTKEKYKGNFAALLPASRNESGGLPSELHLTVGARVLLKKNINGSISNLCKKGLQFFINCYSSRWSCER